ncbi:hypothetical protein ACH0BF_16285 [Pseudobacillus sp. 179-B 2D1 NHS]|uniref:hypothetical protein n=1 Tax=Pseudobacillus sp. 179-B 2D1 NHS TaxID=3374292 RepID=UPI00387A4DC4
MKEQQILKKKNGPSIKKISMIIVSVLFSAVMIKLFNKSAGVHNLGIYTTISYLLLFSFSFWHLLLSIEIIIRHTSKNIDTENMDTELPIEIKNAKKTWKQKRADERDIIEQYFSFKQFSSVTYWLSHFSFVPFSFLLALFIMYINGELAISFNPTMYTIISSIVAVISTGLSIYYFRKLTNIRQLLLVVLEEIISEKESEQ